VRHCHASHQKSGFYSIDTFAIFLKPLILRTLRARKIKGFRKMAIMLFYCLALITEQQISADNVACAYSYDWKQMGFPSAFSLYFQCLDSSWSAKKQPQDAA